ncbi:hypothetical protein P3X46_008442 [Hevea brasiliensis]|uniref:Exportin-5 C-terminal domain-containing protein n=1 Tax=Hevea brasiliensis TaxID=3981 RepID=A0ABQ9MIN8_HEVBR|nr:hypothetical protein P3X46_008442 [Hevea brasiliensis]
MTMSDAERFALLGEGNPKLPKGPLTFTDGSQFDKYKEGSAEINESDIRNWLKGIRDSSFLLKHKGLAFPALQICIEAFTWTDSEAVTKVSSFCAPVILLTIATNNAELREFVSKDLFYVIIKGLELESNAVISADLIGLCREIFMYLRDRDPAPRQGNYYCPCYFNALDKVLSLKSYI